MGRMYSGCGANLAQVWNGYGTGAKKDAARKRNRNGSGCATGAGRVLSRRGPDVDLQPSEKAIQSLTKVLSPKDIVT